MPSWIGPWEIAIVLVLALLIFGPKKLPDLGSSLGRSITGVKKGLKETKDDVQSAIKEDVTADTPSTTETPATAAAATATATTATSETPATETAETTTVAADTAVTTETTEQS
jgi:sec-independent protein translocase protein TatA